MIRHNARDDRRAGSEPRRDVPQRVSRAAAGAPPRAFGLAVWLLPAAPPLAGGGRGRRAGDLSERLPEPETRHASARGLGVAPAHRPQRLLHAYPLGTPARGRRADRGHHCARGDRRGARSLVRLAPRPHGCASDASRAAARGDPAPRMAGDVARRDRRAAGDHALRCGDTDLPRPALARRGARRTRASGAGSRRCTSSTLARFWRRSRASSPRARARRRPRPSLSPPSPPSRWWRPIPPASWVSGGSPWPRRPRLPGHPRLSRVVRCGRDRYRLLDGAAPGRRGSACV